MNKLCQHNFGNNRQPIAFENYAGIIGAYFLRMRMTYAAMPLTLHMEADVEDAVPSLLERLKSPTSSTLARKRKVTKNTPPTGSKKGKGAVVAAPQSISPTTRVKEFPEEGLCVSSGKLFTELKLCKNYRHI